MRSFDPAKVPKPELQVDSEIFESKNPIDLEIGAGQGLHAISYAKTHLDRTLIAVEQTHTRFAKLQQRVTAHSHLRNLIPYQVDAIAFCSHFVPNETLSQVFILYPNPYPKSKQANLRWHNRPFLSLLIAKMKPFGELTLATNMEYYALEARAAMLSRWCMTELDFTVIPQTANPRTHFEKKYLERGEVCWNLHFRKGKS